MDNIKPLMEDTLATYFVKDTHFSPQSVKSKPFEKQAGRNRPLTLLPLNRANNISITILQLKLPFPALLEPLMNGNDSLPQDCLRVCPQSLE